MNSYIKGLIDKLELEHILTKEDFLRLLQNNEQETYDYLFQRADAVRKEIYGKDIYMRGLIEFTNYCKKDCYYCGIRKSNKQVERYRLSKDEIIDCCVNGYSLGFRTFVLQGGEDNYYTDEKVIDIVKAIKDKYPDCAITLSIGEKSRESYQAFFEAGADRYLLRHETANAEHYSKLHPKDLSLENRKKCLRDLKDIGYEVGCGFMVGSPYQTLECLIEDLLFIRELEPDMVGIGPFIPHKDTIFARELPGTMEQSLLLLGIIRLMLPNVLLPATTALGTIHPSGREKGIKAGANVVMPNLSPTNIRDKYTLYDNKICTGDEAAECRMCIENRIAGIGYRLVVDRGDHKQMIERKTKCITKNLK